MLVPPDGQFADIEHATITHLSGFLSTANVSTQTPADFGGRLPFHRVTAGPGADDGITERAVVDVETFAAGRASARDAAEKVREAMRHMASTVPVAGALIDNVSTVSRPQFVEYRNPRVTRFVASYRVSQRLSRPGSLPAAD
jgi:hypothetical protein